MGYDTPTDEQAAAIDLARTGQDLAIEALAGTGKTSTLSLIARDALLSGVYVTFNKAMATAAKSRFPGHIDCRTAHSLAFRAVGHRFSSRLNGPKPSSQEVAQTLGCAPFDARSEFEGRVTVPAASVAAHVVRSMGLFVKTLDDEPTREHALSIRAPSSILREAFIDHVAEYLPRAWKDLQSPDGVLPFTHDVYLKLWHRERPRIETDVVMFDEAQDADPVMLDIVLSQAAQKILVGDRHQQVYEWRGAVNAMEGIPFRARTWLTQSFRFGDAIATEANVHLAALKSPHLLKGNPEIQSVVGPADRPHAILCRTNGGVLAAVLRCQQGGASVAVSSGLDALLAFARAAQSLQSGRTVPHPDLTCFGSWAAVRTFAATDECDADLRRLVQIVEAHGCADVIGALESCVEPRWADVLVTTAHRSKGSEWQIVGLASDFVKAEKMDENERRLIYVATTRARHRLDVSHWRSGGAETLSSWFAPPTPASCPKATHVSDVAGDTRSEPRCPRCGSDELKSVHDQRQDLHGTWCLRCWWQATNVYEDPATFAPSSGQSRERSEAPPTTESSNDSHATKAPPSPPSPRTDQTVASDAPGTATGCAVLLAVAAVTTGAAAIAVFGWR